MSTHKSATDWMKLSQDYWKGWQDLTQQALRSAQAEHSAAPWHEGLEQWARLFRGTPGHSDASNILDQLLDHGRGYLQFLQQVAGNPAAFSSDDLRATAQRMVAELQGANPFGQALPLAGTPLGETFAQWLKAWQDGLAPLQAEAAAWGRLPAFGLQREYVEQAQAFNQAQQRLAAANQAYSALLSRALEGGLERFQSKLADREEPGGRRVENLRALYDVFIDALEESYAEIALDNEFRAVYGELVNAQSDLRLQVQRIVEQISASLGMPTRSEVNTLGARLQELRRAQRKHAEHPALAALKAELDQLRSEVAALRSAGHGGAHDDDELPASAARPAGRKPAIQTRALSSVKSAAKTTAKAPSKRTPKGSSAEPSKTATQADARAEAPVPKKAATAQPAGASGKRTRATTQKKV